MGSGPLRALARVEHELFAKLGYAEAASRGVLVLETRRVPTEQVAAWIAQRAGLDPSQLALIVAPTASIAGCVQIAARSLETGLHKMDSLGFDVTRVVSGVGTAPVPPVPADDIVAIGRTNDCILYGAQARYAVDASDDELASLAERLPAEASRDYGTPFHEIFARYNNDFYKIDPLLFSPAEVWLTSCGSGRTFHAGQAQSGRAEAIAVRVAATRARHDSQRPRRVAHRRAASRAQRARRRLRVRRVRDPRGAHRAPAVRRRSLTAPLGIAGRRGARAHHPQRVAGADHFPRGCAPLARGARHPAS